MCLLYLIFDFLWFPLVYTNLYNFLVNLGTNLNYIFHRVVFDTDLHLVDFWPCLIPKFRVRVNWHFQPLVLKLHRVIPIRIQRFLVLSILLSFLKILVNLILQTFNWLVGIDCTVGQHIEFWVVGVPFILTFLNFVFVSSLQIREQVPGYQNLFVKSYIYVFKLIQIYFWVFNLLI